MVIRRCPTGFVLRDATLADLLGDPDVLLPLPFTPEADPATVVAHLRRLNPHRTVRFDPLPLDEPAPAQAGDGAPDAAGSEALSATGHWPPPVGGERADADRRRTGP